MTIEQKFHDYCEGCPMISVEHHKDGARCADGRMVLSQNYITCKNYQLCGLLWERLSTMPVKTAGGYGRQTTMVEKLAQASDYDLKPCPFCKEEKVFIGVHDDEGNYHGRLGCDYELDPWSGLSYALHHDGWGGCILCSDGENEVMGGVSFDTAEEAAAAWNNRE